LLQQLAGVRLVVKTHNELNLAALPVEIQAMNTQNANKRHSFTLKNANQVEQVLASVRMAGGELEDVLVSQADLEDVFVKLVNTTVDTNPVEEK
jgi:ABC-2 type transport system ATP-binding protein